MEKIGFDSQNYIEYSFTPWDSRVFGYETNEINNIFYTNIENLNNMLNMFEEKCLMNKIMFTNYRANPQDKNVRKSLSEFGYYNVETSIKIERSMKNFDPSEYNISSLNINIIKYTNKYYNDLQSITFDIFKHGRFFEDPYISIELAQLRNKNWIDDLIKCSNIYLGTLNSAVIGFMAYTNFDKKIILQLGGVKYPLFAYPFWLKLFIEFVKNLKTHDISCVISGSNIGVLNLYSYFGFKFIEAYFGYHKHRGLK